MRIGNGAVNQLQLDIYGELMDAVYLYDKYGEPISYDCWLNITRLIEWVCAHWREKDETIWEFRTDRREYLYSRLMCWVALDRAIRLAWKRSFPAPIARWHDIRDTIYRDIMDAFLEARSGSLCPAQRDGGPRRLVSDNAAHENREPGGQALAFYYASSRKRTA